MSEELRARRRPPTPTRSTEKHRSASEDRDWSLNQWMSDIPDDQLVSLISVPGTHASAATTGGIIHECQFIDILTQLRSGVRFLDIQCRVVSVGPALAFAVYHDGSPVGLMFDDVLDACKKFFRRYSWNRDTIFMRLRQEGSASSEDIWAYVFRNRYASDLFWRHPYVPTMGEARGKIVALQCDPGVGGLPYGDGVITQERDDRICGNKPGYVMSFMHDSLNRNQQTDTRVYLNFLNPANYQGWWPDDYDRCVRPAIDQAIEIGFPSWAHGAINPPLGIIAWDSFDDDPLQGNIIQWNWGGPIPPAKA